MSRPRVSFKTVGCRLNRAETASIAAGSSGPATPRAPFADRVVTVRPDAVRGDVLEAPAPADSAQSH